LALLLAAGLWLAPVQGWAIPLSVPFPAPTLLAQAGAVSLDQAVAQVQRRVGGRVLSAETRMEDGVPVHHVRVLTSSQRVRTIRVDGRTGEWL
jgi:uncharacterized membrane protein YkoI